MHIVQDTNSPDAANIIFKIAQSQRIVILTGAGISRASGIPDFRSEDGLYQQHQHSTGPNPKDVLHIDSLSSEKGIQQLYSLLRAMWSTAIGGHHTNAHLLIAVLYRIRRLVGYFTQNIDGLDESLGILPMDFQDLGNPYAVLVQLHGSLLWLRCNRCTWKEPVTEQWWAKLQGSKTHLSCPVCPEVSRSGRRIQGGIVHTNILLYGEPHPHGEDVASSFKFDTLHQPNLLLIMGTSLDTSNSTSLVQLVKELSKSIKSQNHGCVIYVNKDLPPSTLYHDIDIMLGGDLQTWSTCIMSQLKALGVDVNPLLPSIKLGLQPGSILSPYAASTAFSNTPEDTTVTTNRHIAYVIILFTKASTSTAEFLRHAIQRSLQQSPFPYVLWYLEWDKFNPLDPKMFGISGTNKGAICQIYLVCSSTPNSTMSEFCESRWPPTRQFFQKFMTIAMHKFVAHSHSSRLCTILHQEAYTQDPQPLWSLYNYATQGSFTSYILFEPKDSSMPAELLALLAVMPVNGTHKDVVQAIAEVWSHHLITNHYSMCQATFIGRGDLPVTLQDASPDLFPFGNDLSWVKSSCNTCGTDADWVGGHYVEDDYFPLCGSCLQNGLPVSRPTATRLFTVFPESEPSQTSWVAISARYATSDDQDELLTGII